MKQPPPFPIAFADSRVVVRPHSRSDTIGDLAAALTLPRPHGLSVDGRHAAHYETLVGARLRAGSVVTAAGIAHEPADDIGDIGDIGDVVVEVVVVTGPDCAAPVALRPGRHVVGRSPSADLRVDDPAIELHHGILDVDADGGVTFRQLTGRVAAMIGTVSCDGTVEVPLGAVLSIGSSGLVVRRPGGPTGIAASGRLSDVVDDPWRRTVQRGPAEPPGGPPPAIRVPVAHQDEPFPPATGLIAAAVAVVVAVVVGFLFGQLMFALFAGLGAVASVATWAAGVGSVCRKRRAGRAATRRDRARFATELDAGRAGARDAHARAHPPIERALEMAASLDETVRTDIWRRRLADDSSLRAVLGRGAQRWVPALEGAAEHDEPAVAACTELADVAVPIALPEAATLAIRGDEVRARGLVCAVLVQLAAHYGPADWRLIVVSRRPAAWRWVTWLPHAAGDGVIDAADVSGATLDAGAGRDVRRIVLVVDDVEVLATRTGAVRRFIDVARPSTIAVVHDGATVPAVCARVLDIGATGEARWSTTGDPDQFGDGLGPFRPAGISTATAIAAARRLAALLDPEDETGPAATIPHAVTLGDIDPVIESVGQPDTALVPRAASAAVARRWEHAGRDPRPVAALGVSAEGLVEVDLVGDGPHALIAGTTGAGKSELLRTLVVSLAMRLSPDHLTFVLVDYKGGSTFDACAGLPHTVGLVTDLDAGLAERALVSLEAELHRRERLLRAVGASDLADYRSRHDDDPLPRLVVVIDEFAALAKDLPDFLAALVGVAQRGRSLGLHLILATQRPAGVVNDDIRANTNLRIALRLGDEADARDVVDDDAPSRFSRGVPGRAVLRLGPGERVTFQTASCTGDVRTAPSRLRVERAERAEARVGTARQPQSQLAAAVAAVTDAARSSGVREPHRPWIDPLPDSFRLDAVEREVPDARAAGAIGLVDDPAGQCRRALRWATDSGNLALVGGLGAGRAATLVALIAARCATSEPERSHCYVVDARGDAIFAGVAELAHCGGVVRVGDLELVHRLLARIVSHIDDRVDVQVDDRVVPDADEHPAVLLAINGMTSLRTALATVDRAPTLALLDRVLVDGPAAGVVSCWSDDGDEGSASPASETWRFGGVASDGVERVGLRVVPGRVRVSSSGLEGQVAADAGCLSSLPRGGGGRGPVRIDRLPARVRASTILEEADAPARSWSSPVELPIGVADDGLGVATLRVPACDHVFVGGAALTGKTTVLRQLSQAWRRRHPSGSQLFVDRRDPLTRDRLGASLADGDGDGGDGDGGDAERVADAVLVVVDDAERIDDVDGAFASILAGEYPGVTIAVAARMEAVRAGYGHWTRDVARSRCGVILTSAGDVDGDLLGVMLPRRPMIAPRPGLGWVIDSRGHRLVQIAQADVEFVGG